MLLLSCHGGGRPVHQPHCEHRGEAWSRLRLLLLLSMKLVIDVKDSKAEFVKELLDSLSYVKTKTISTTKARFLEELKESVREIALAKKGKIKLQSAREFLNEL
jgi:hypothetical protein